MKIEFKKVPLSKNQFHNDYNSVKIEGTFSKISPSLVKVESTLTGKVEVDCCKCGTSFDKNLSEELNFFISKGIYNGDEEDLVIEIDDEFIDFDEICESEISSIQSEYHICSNCASNDEIIEKEF